jgi:putative hydrolase of the HAD superfamily
MLAKFSVSLIFIFLLVCFLGSVQASQKSNVNTIVFDFGGVIAKSDHSEVVEFIAKSLNISLKDAAEALVELKVQSTQGISDEDFWLVYTNSKGIKLPDNWIDQLNDAKFHSLRIIPGMVDLVKELQKQGYQTALLSNVRKSQAQIKSQLGYYELFHPALFSYEIGVCKPDPKAYQILLDRLRLSAESVLFIDNKLVNVEAAKQFGIDGILFIDTNHLIADLKQRSIEISLSDQSSFPAKK